MLFQKLKEATSEIHAITEQENFTEDIRNHTLSFSQYIILLRANYLFHFTIGKELEGYFSIRPEFEISKRLRFDLLAEDLKLAGEAIPASLPPYSIKSFAEALGNLYVLEGSTLGGRYILKAALNIPGVKEKNAFSFYEGYGQETGIMWKKLMQAGNEIMFPAEETAQAVAGAKKAFQLFADIIRTEKLPKL